MNDADLENIKRRKLEEFQQNYNDQFQEQAKFEQQIQQLEVIVKQNMTKEAIQRYSNIKMVDAEKALQVLAVIGQLLQTGKIQKVDDEILKEILITITPKKKEFNIKR